MNVQLSHKIRNLSFLLMVLVVCIHGYNENLRFVDQTSAGPSYWLRFLQRFSSDGFCRVAVPLFFAISGYLASESMGRTWGLRSYLNLLKKRFFSLLLPYLLVSAAGIALVVLLQIFPFSKPFFNNYRLENSSIQDWLRVWLLDPVPFPLWFIRFLLNYFLFFPVLFLAVRYLREVFLLPAMLAWMWPLLYQKFGVWKIAFSLGTFLFCFLSGTDFGPYLPTQKNELEGLFFFALGIYASVHGVPLIIRKDAKWPLWLLPLWLGWVAYRTFLVLEIPPPQLPVHFHQVAFTLTGSILVWYLYDLFAENLDNSSRIRRYAPYSVGVFLFHEPLLTILKKGMVRLAGPGDASVLISFLLSPALAFAAALFFAVILAKRFPGLYNVFTGNRSPAADRELS